MISFGTDSELEKSIETLEKGLLKFPSDKQIHLQIALHLIERDRTPTPEIDGHFLASYSVGDHAIDARFYHACYLFWAGEIERSRKLFDEVENRTSEEYRKKIGLEENPIDRFIEEKTGTVAGVRTEFFLIQSGCYPKQIFAHASALQDVELDDISTGIPVRFRVSFNRRGPVAAKVFVR